MAAARAPSVECAAVIHEASITNAEGRKKRALVRGELLLAIVNARWHRPGGAAARFRVRRVGDDEFGIDIDTSENGVPLAPAEDRWLYVALKFDTRVLPAGDYRVELRLSEVPGGDGVLETEIGRFWICEVGSPITEDAQVCHGFITDPRDLARVAPRHEEDPPAPTMLQFEASAACDLRCPHCYREHYAGVAPDHDRVEPARPRVGPSIPRTDSWQSAGQPGREIEKSAGGNLPEALWQRLRPSLSAMSFLDMGGWGEPLLNGRLTHYAKDARDAGVGAIMFSTHGGLLEGQRAELLLESAVTDINVSIDAARPATYAKNHSGADLDAVFANIGRFLKRRRELSRRTPRIHASFVMLASNIDELPEFIDRCADLAVDHVVLRPAIPFSNADGAEMLAAGLYPFPGDPPRLEQRLNLAVERARQRGVIIYETAREDFVTEAARCFCNAHLSPFLRADGLVAPCCFLASPVDRLLPDGGVVNHGVVTFGSLHERTLEDIWQSDDYRAFRARHRRHREPLCHGCPARHLFAR